MNLRKADTDTLLDLRDINKEQNEAIDKEIRRRLKEQEQATPEMITLSRLASREGITPQGLKKRCKRHGVPLVDKDGNPTGPGKTAYVNLKKYYNRR